MRYKKVEEFLKENALFLDKKCKNCTGSLEAKDFSASGCTRYECTQCGTSYTPDGKQTVTANRVKAANENVSVEESDIDKDNWVRQADVIMWLYKTHGIWIEVTTDVNGKFCWLVKELKASNNNYNSPTKAYEAAILYCLENLETLSKLYHPR